MESNYNVQSTEHQAPTIAQEYLQMADFIVAGFNNSGSDRNTNNSASVNPCNQCEGLSNENQQIKASLKELEENSIVREKELGKYVKYSMKLKAKVDLVQAAIHSKNETITELNTKISTAVSQNESNSHPGSSGQQMTSFRRVDKIQQTVMSYANPQEGFVNVAQYGVRPFSIPGGNRNAGGSYSQGPAVPHNPSTGSNSTAKPIRGHPATSTQQTTANLNLHCVSCNRTFLDPIRFTMHNMLSHDMIHLTGTTKDRYKCRLCEQAFPTNHGYIGHYRVSHQTQ